MTDSDLQLVRRDLTLRSGARDGQNEFLAVGAVKPLLLFDGFQVIVNDQPFALRRRSQVFGEEAIRQALARDLFAPADDDLNREKVDLGAATEFNQEAGHAAEARRALQECDLMRVEVVEIKEIASGGLCVVKDRATFGSDPPPVTRLGFRFVHEPPPIGRLMFLPQAAEFRVRYTRLPVARGEINRPQRQT